MSRFGSNHTCVDIVLILFFFFFLVEFILSFIHPTDIYSVPGIHQAGDSHEPKSLPSVQFESIPLSLVETQGQTVISSLD